MGKVKQVLNQIKTSFAVIGVVLIGFFIGIIKAMATSAQPDVDITAETQRKREETNEEIEKLKERRNNKLSIRDRIRAANHSARERDARGK